MNKKTKINWQEYSYIENQSYKNIQHYGGIEAEFEGCTFLNVTFYWCHFNGIDFKNSTFENCTFMGSDFDETNFVKCFFQKCTFTKGNIGSHCKADKSYAIDCHIDEKSLKNNPLTIQLSKDTLLLTPKLKKQLYKTFKNDRPKQAVDEPKHCLSCDETQITHEKITDLKQLNVDHFNICYMSVETFSEDALLYYMPKLLELLLLGKENKWDNYRNGILRQLIPNKFGDRFNNYNKEQINLIIEVLELWYNKHNRIEEIWDYEAEMMTDNSWYKEQLEHCGKALEFWKEKSK